MRRHAMIKRWGDTSVRRHPPLYACDQRSRHGRGEHDPPGAVPHAPTWSEKLADPPRHRRRRTTAEANNRPNEPRLRRSVRSRAFRGKFGKRWPTSADLGRHLDEPGVLSAGRHAKISPKMLRRAIVDECLGGAKFGAFVLRPAWRRVRNFMSECQASFRRHLSTLPRGSLRAEFDTMTSGAEVRQPRLTATMRHVGQQAFRNNHRSVAASGLSCHAATAVIAQQSGPATTKFGERHARLGRTWPQAQLGRLHAELDRNPAKCGRIVPDSGRNWPEEA